MYSVGNFFSTVSKFYNEINPATLSGAIDVIVVQQADGELACSPFHVRFGKLSVLRPSEKVVEVRVNGQVIPFSMKVGDAGEAFFVLETEDDVPDEFVTSPIARATDEFGDVDYFELNNNHSNGDFSAQAMDEDALLDNGYVSAASGHSSEFEESLRGDSDNESVASTLPLRRHPHRRNSSLETPLTGPGPAIPATIPPEARSTVDTAIAPDAVPLHQDPPNPQQISFPVNDIFPSVRHEESAGPSRSDSPHRRKSEVLFDMTGYKTDSCSEGSDEDDDDEPRGILSDSERHPPRRFRKKYGSLASRLSEDQRKQLLEDIRQDAIRVSEEGILHAPANGRVPRAIRRTKRSGIPSGANGRKGRKRSSTLPNISGPEPPFQQIVEMSQKVQPLDKAQLPEETTPTPIRRSQRPSVKSDTEMEYETSAPPSTSQKDEWTWGWGTLPTKHANTAEIAEEESPKEKEVPVEIDTKGFQMGSVTCKVALSLCGGDDFGKDPVASHRNFQQSQVSFEAFSKDPTEILADKSLVCYIDGRFYTWANAVPQLAALLFFHQPLSDLPAHSKEHKDDTSSLLSAEGRPTSTRFGAISRWFRKTPTGSVASNSGADTPTSPTTLGVPMESSLSAGSDPEVHGMTGRSKSVPVETVRGSDGHMHSHVAVPVMSIKTAPTTPAHVPDHKNYAKTLRLTSDQLKTLGLNKGANTVSFSVSSAYQGTATCVAKVFLWDHDAQVVISDIDGTITKSDALGHIFAMAGRDWTHLGVAKLFTDIRSNGYHILYLTSRAIGQADYTRKYLQKVEQNSYQLPDGPVIMSPDRLFSAFHREVIIRKPEVFKMSCLRDVKRLFGDRNPFYAGFGNRITDALSYRSVNVPPSRIFTIDSYGEVKLELLSSFKSSYLALNDLVNEIFPGQKVTPEYNDWNFWKTDFPKIEMPELPLAGNNLYGTGPSSSSLLSSTTSAAKKVVSFTSSSQSGTMTVKRLVPADSHSPASETP